MDFKEKINFIYSENPSSPVFVRAAAIEFEKENFETAVKILQEGINKYENHPTAHLLLGKIFMKKGDYEQALHYFKTGCREISSEDTYEYYCNEVEKEKRKKREDDFYERTSSFERVKRLIEEIDAIGTIDDELEELAQKISKAKMPRITNDASGKETIDENLNNKKTPLVSETLANIYLAQGNHHEALEAFQMLAKKNPLRKNYYEKKIEEIKSDLDNK